MQAIGFGPPSLIVVTGMARETKLAAGPGTLVVTSGGDSDRLRRLLAVLPPDGRRAVVSFGVAGGLHPDLVSGDLVVATAIRGPARQWRTDATLAEWLARRLGDGAVKARLAEIAGTDAPVVDAASKADLHGETGAAVVDMESHVAADYAETHGLAFAAIRAVCDPHLRSLPPLAMQALTAEGDLSISGVLASMLANPAQVKALPQLARDAGAAFAALRRCRDLLGIGRGLPDFFELLSDVA